MTRVAPEAAGQAGESGACRVRRVLVDRLQGLAPPRRVPRGAGQPRDLTAAEVAAALEVLCDDLAHLTEVQLQGLAGLAVRQAGLAAGGPRMPPVQVLRAWGWAMDPAPQRQARAYVASVMQSRLGEAASRAGCHVALLRHLRRVAPPPPEAGGYAWQQLVQAQDGDLRRRARVAEKLRDFGADRVNAADTAFAAAWDQDAAEALALVAEGVAKREVRA